MARTLAFKVLPHCVVVVGSAVAPNDADWQAYIDGCRPLVDKPTVPPFLIVTDGGSPSPTQRKMVYDIVKDKVIRQAVITPSKLTVGIITAISWFNKGIKAFAPDKLDAAFEYLEIDPTKRAGLMAEVTALQRQIDR